MQKVNVSLDENLLSRADDFAKRYGLNRSALVSVALNDYMYAKDKEPELKALLEDFEKKLKSYMPEQN